MLNPLSSLDLDLSAIVTVPIIRFTDSQRYSLRFEISMTGREAKFSIKLRSKMQPNSRTFNVRKNRAGFLYSYDNRMFFIVQDSYFIPPNLF